LLTLQEENLRPAKGTARHLLFRYNQMKSLHTLLSSLPSYTLLGDAHALARGVQNVQYDSRRCKEDSLFVAIRGLRFDGHDFIDDAIARGARFIVAEEERETPNNVALALTPNSRHALADIAHAWHDYPSEKMRIFGVTGTNGKTTCTFILRRLLEAMGETVGVIGTTGNYIADEVLPSEFTTPESLELCELLTTMRKRGVTSVAMEVSSHALAMERVRGVRFAGAIFTNLTQDHLDFHGTMEKYALAKKRLFDMVSEDAIAVVNADDAASALMLSDSRAARKIMFGRSANADVRIANERLSFAGTHLSLSFRGANFESAEKTEINTMEVHIPLIGEFNCDNFAACAAMAWGLGMPLDDLRRAAQERVEGAPGRMQRLPLLGGKAVAIVDYAHTPDALEKSLLACRRLLRAQEETTRQSGRIVCVFGCGGDRDRTKRPKMGAIASKLADAVILTSDNPRTEDPLTIIDDILAGIPQERFSAIVALPDRKEAIRAAIAQMRAGDIALIAGKGHETYQILGAHKIHFDDAEEIEVAANATRAGH
jgi:UDP-N-acetylmuramoyl-L-alanyl-D-glutamate--2,6-diaminopimelate ligase